MQIYKIETDEDGRELTTHGVSDFPCASYDECFSKFFEGEVPWHWHDEVEIVLVVEGSTKLECIGKDMVLNVGEMAFINAGSLHKLTNHGTGDCRILNAVFNPQMIGGMNFSRIYKKHVLPVINNNELNCYHFKTALDWHKEVIHELQHAYDVWKLGRDDYEFVMTMALMKFWYLFGQNAPEIMSNTQVQTNQEKRLHILLNYMHSHYASHLSVAEISAAANISESECYRLFRHTLKTTPNRYLLSHRLRMAAQMLVESDKTITQITYDTGFSCPAYFAKKFKATFAKTPKVFRQASRNNSA
jgi:AraC-like DNA-binding protein/mannose-6-phosphate isomerase-like protein (cupin superfamily)